MKAIFISIFILFSIELFSQATLTIEEVNVYKLKYTESISEGNEGTVLLLNCKLINNDSIPLKIKDGKYFLQFRYENKTYVAPSRYSSYFSPLNVNLVKNEEIKFECDFLPILELSILSGGPVVGRKLDFSEILLQILPTMKLKVKADKKEIVSSGIKNVTIHKDEEE